MRVLAALLTVCLVRLCHSVGYLTTCCGGSPTNPITLDLSDPDESLCRALKTNVDGLPAKIYLLKSKKVNKIVNRNKKVWIGKFGDKCFYCMAFLKDNEPRIVVIGAESSARKSLKYYKYKDKTGCRGKPGWKKSRSSYKKKISALKLGSNAPTKFTLDISFLEEDDERFKLTKSVTDGITILYYSLQPGHLIEKIVDGEKEVWTAGNNQVCYLCEYYPKSASGKVKLHIMKNKDSFSFTLFDKVDGSWKKK
ncbi:hypothetical protein BEWA_016080 [Theileria equi strain WA]|uniref:Signal peptide containing protein n=1 Tax=Theileria equi strain WA TaxID=1537102 RepID=L1LC71_THEEQ|nr:hypothetical protein BEWA_016080 [Theileria equi strain WA]EKX73047.1 hypothetical protein BEWA_016080 [Theileria equi strain WA]|eukprot:XP_004832499.1 hypothetical protein BEWA_016080 [Theileria equi strain WA]